MRLFVMGVLFVAACGLARVTAAAQSSYEERLQMAWLLLQNQEYEAAVGQYEKAVGLRPEALDPWLGLQAAKLGLNDPASAMRAGERALALDPSNYWARLRQAYAAYLLKDYATARELYLGLIAENPRDPEVLLGLGATRLRQGDSAGVRDCREAGKRLGKDPRVDECLALDLRARVLWSVVVGGTYLRYTSPWNNNAVVGASGSASMELENGLGLWLGGSYGLTQLRYQRNDFHQAGPAGGLFFRPGPWSVGLYGAWLGSSHSSVHGGFLLGGHGGYQGKWLGLFLDGSWVRYPGFSTVQLDPRLKIVPNRIFRLVAGPQLIVLGKGHAPVSGKGAGATLLWNGQLGAELEPVKVLQISLSGFYGMRAYFVEDYGLSVWSSSDRFIGGFDLKLTWSIVSALRIFLGWRHHFGDRQQGRVHDFALFGPSLGLSAVF
jgi:hypothetical protein